MQGSAILAIVRYLSRYFETHRLQTKRISEIIHCLKLHWDFTWSHEYNSPFNASEFKAFAEKYGFSHVTLPRRYSGAVQRTRGNVQRQCRKRNHDQSSRIWLWSAIVIIRPHKTLSENGTSPVQTMFSRDLPTADQLLTVPRAREINELALIQVTTETGEMLQYRSQILLDAARRKNSTRQNRRPIGLAERSDHQETTFPFVWRSAWMDVTCLVSHRTSYMWMTAQRLETVLTGRSGSA